MKGLAVTFHFRGRADEREAVRELDAIAETAREQGLVARYGRKVLEVLPPVGANKGTAVRRLLDEHGLRARSRPATTRRTSTPSPRSTVSRSRCAWPSRRPRRRRALLDAADIVVGSTDEFLALLRRL